MKNIDDFVVGEKYVVKETTSGWYWDNDDTYVFPDTVLIYRGPHWDNDPRLVFLRFDEDGEAGAAGAHWDFYKEDFPPENFEKEGE